jgi:hypothetical protein
MRPEIPINDSSSTAVNVIGERFHDCMTGYVLSFIFLGWVDCYLRISSQQADKISRIPEVDCCELVHYWMNQPFHLSWLNG